MALRVKLQLVVMADDNEVSIDDIVVLDKQCEQLEHIGLGLQLAARAARLQSRPSLPVTPTPGRAYAGRSNPGNEVALSRLAVAR